MSRASRSILLVPALASLGLVASCDENLPEGPVNFSAGVRILIPNDTIVVGDSSLVTAEVTDAQARKVQGLAFEWTTSNANVLGVVHRQPIDSSSRHMVFLGKRAGLSTVNLKLPDPRFVSVGAARIATVVVGGVRVLSTRDSTMTAIGDTGVAIAAGLVRVNGAPVPRASQGLRWTQLGNRTSVVGTGDTVRYIARGNGVDTLIATADFCLRGAKCADTVIVRVAQVLSLGLSARNFQAYSFKDSVGPTVMLADRRGNGLAGTSIRFIPRTAADSLVVRSVGPFGTSNPVTGAMAAPKLETQGNGQARVAVVGMSPDNLTVVASDTITVVVRQVARRVAVEPLRGSMSLGDSIPILPLARDARGAVIADATISVLATGVPLDDIWAGPTTTLVSNGTIVPTLSGIALPSVNPGAPQIPVTVDPSIIVLFDADSVVAGTTESAITFQVLDSVSQPAFGRWVRFRAPAGTTPDSVQVGFNGFATVTWVPPNVALNYTLTGVLGTVNPMNTLADSAGRIVLRKTLKVVADKPHPVLTQAEFSATTIAVNGTATLTVRVKDQYGNLVKDATGASFTATPSVGAFSGATCTEGVCTMTYTAPNAAGPATVTVQVNSTNVLNGVIALTIQ